MFELYETTGRRNGKATFQKMESSLIISINIARGENLALTALHRSVETLTIHNCVLLKFFKISLLFRTKLQ